MSYLLLFLASFLAATVIPFSSEVLFYAMLEGERSFILLLLVASIGNTLGGLVNYLLGAWCKWSWLQRYFGIKEEKVQRFARKYANKGAFTAVFCWLPFVGDVLAVALGFLKVRFKHVVIWMLLGKTIRYAVLVYLFQNIS